MPSICTETDLEDTSLPSITSFGKQGCHGSSPSHESIAEQIANEFTLNEDQRRSFMIVANQAMMERGSPLRMYISGEAGTGKSRVIDALQQFFNHTRQGRRFRVCSFMGVAAENVSGSTLHSALNLNEWHNNR
ncbi:hypothetical protein EV363DRAFT_1180216, partial [Boletus edulis]